MTIDQVFKEQREDNIKVGGIPLLEYKRIHYWLRTNFGNAYKCENKECLNKSKWYEWALIKNRKYEYKRDNFMMLCKSCHSIIDISDNTRKKWKTFWETHKTYTVKCKICSEETISYYNKPKQCQKCRKRLMYECFQKRKRKYKEFYKNKSKEYYLKNMDKIKLRSSKNYYNKKLLSKQYG